MPDFIDPVIAKDLEDLKNNPPNLGKKKGNGHSTHSPVAHLVDSPPPAKSIAFQVGIDTICVPEMTWDILETVMPMLESKPDPEAKWYQTKVRDFEIFLIVSKTVCPDMTMEKLKKLLTMSQAMDLSAKLMDLLVLSGFNIPGEVKAASDSTETLIVSSPESSEEGTQELLNGTKSNV